MPSSHAILILVGVYGISWYDVPVGVPVSELRKVVESIY